MAKQKHLERRHLTRLLASGTITLVCVGLSVFGLVQNSQGAVERYDQLKAVDMAGGDVEEALDELRTYIYQHMNTKIGSETGINPPIQLKGTYDRLVAAEEQRVQQTNGNLYSEAQADCERSQPSGFSGRNRLDCIEAYIDANGGVTAREINADLYRFDFVPPVWSPDLAGFSIVFAIIFGLVFIIDLLLYVRIRRLVNI